MTTRNRTERTRQLLAELNELLYRNTGSAYDDGLWIKLSRMIGSPLYPHTIDNETKKLTRVREITDTLSKIYKVEEETK